MSTDPALILAQWMSPAFPVGAFAFSHGLEAVIEAGEVDTANALQEWLTALLQNGSAANDAVFVSHGYRAQTANDLKDLTDLCIGFCSSAGRVLETREQGASFARTLRKIDDHNLPDLPYPIAVGHAAALYGLPLPATLRFFLHGFVANLISAAVRRVPLGQTEGQRVLSALHPVIETTAESIQSKSLDDLTNTCFAADIAAMQHETLYSKTFRT
ncbi:MAG: urease accessory protein UreF [Aliishimia sp.]